MSEEEPRRRRAALIQKLLETQETPTPQVPAFPLGINLFEQHVVENRVYKNVQINLDGYTFKNCAFVGCDLRTSKGNFDIQDCHFSSCTVYFFGNALKVVRLSSLLLENWSLVNQHFHAKAEPDGGVTI